MVATSSQKTDKTSSDTHQPQTALDRTEQLQAIIDSLRPGQKSLAQWGSGPLAVSAVPGSGKSTGMAAGAAIAIAHHQLHARKQLVLVTFTRSAAANLKAKVRQHLKALCPYHRTASSSTRYTDLPSTLPPAIPKFQALTCRQ